MKKRKNEKKRSQADIDNLVVAQSESDAAWSEPIQVKRVLPASFVLPRDVAVRAEFFSRLHRSKNLRDWLTRIIQERLEIEEAAYNDLKRDLIKSR